MGFVCTVGILALLVSVQCVTRDQLFDYGIRFGDQILDSGPDSVHELELEQTLHFFKGKFDKVYVSNFSMFKFVFLSLKFNQNFTLKFH